MASIDIDVALRPYPAERLGGLSWAHFLNDGAANFLPGILPAILLELHLSVGLAGSIVAALLIGQGLQPFFGLLADRLGGRMLVIAGLLGSSIGAALVGWTHSIGWLLVVLVLIGVSNSLFHPQALSGVRRLPIARQSSAMAVFLVGGEIGRGLWPMIASGIVVHFGRGLLWIMALPALATLPFLLRWAPRLPARKPNAAPIQWRRHAGPLSLLVAYCGVRALMIFCVVTYLPLIWTEAGGSMTAGASLITVVLVVGVIGNLGGGWIGDRFRARPILLLTMLASTVALAAMTQLTGVWLWLVCGVLGIALFSTLPLTIVIAQDMLPENRSFGGGLALGLANALGAVGLMLVSPLAGYAGVGAALWVAAGGGLIAAAIAMRVATPEPSQGI